MLQQFNFGTSTTDAPAEASEDEPEEEVATESQAEAHLDADNQSNQPEEEGVKSIIDSSSTEADEDPKTELEEPSERTSSKSRKKHIMREEDDEPSEEPPISDLSRKDKEKVNNPSTSEDEVEDINTELEAAATRVTRTSIETKHLLDIITAITGEWSAVEKLPQLTHNKLPANSFSLVLKDLTRENGALLKVLLPQTHQRKRGPDLFRPERLHPLELPQTTHY